MTIRFFRTTSVLASKSTRRRGIRTNAAASASASDADADETTVPADKPRLSLLDLRRSGLSVLERLVLEEGEAPTPSSARARPPRTADEPRPRRRPPALLRHDPRRRSWAVLGAHHPTANSVLGDGPEAPGGPGCAAILGIGGKPGELLDLEAVRRDGVLCVKRFSGGGTVVVDRNSLLTTFIGRAADFPEVDPYPRDIMAWSKDVIFEPVFQILRQKNNRDESCGATKFALRENDYVIGGCKKIGGNAQSIVKGAWLHHTSFLWDFDPSNMKYLLLPKKRPEYRMGRNHDEFLDTLCTHFQPITGDGIDLFFDSIISVVEKEFDVEKVSLDDALCVVDNELTSMRTWYNGKCRTKVIIP